MANDRTQAIIQATSAFISQQDLMLTPPEELSPREMVTAYSVLDIMEKQLINKRKASLKEHLLPLAIEAGTEGNTRSKTLPFPDKAKIEARWFKGKTRIDHTKLLAMLEEKGIEASEVYPPVPTFSEKALGALVTLGKISVDDLKEVSTVEDGDFRLYVTKPQAVKALIP